MKSNNKRLRQYIQIVDKRNKQLEVETLLGVSVKKIFIPSIANTVGTDFKKYKIVKKSQFTYIPDTSRRGDKIGLAMLEDYDIALVSQAYTVFEITDHKELDPEYLMMWFRRPEFDRYARFKSHGSVREIFDWDEMCEVELPIPSIEKQHEIVKEYNTIVKRIKLNEQLNKKLEETAQAIYKHWFADFEFPSEEGKPYKSSGGEMVWNEELGKDIPVGWNVYPLDNFIEDSLGGDWGKDKSQGNYKKKVKCVRGTDIPLFKKGNLKNAPVRFILEKNFQSKEVKVGQIIIEISGGSPTQSTGRVVLVTNSHFDILKEKIICSNFCRVLKLKEKRYSRFVFSHIEYLYNLNYLFTYENSTTGVKNFNLNSFLEEEYLIDPLDNLIDRFNESFDTIFKSILINQVEIDILLELKTLLLSKMTKIEPNNL